MKRIIISATLIIMTHPHHNVCMETKKEVSNHTHHEGSIFDHWDNSSHKACEKIKKHIYTGTNINKKETDMSSLYYDMTPLEAATLHGCKRCETFLKKNGARDTELSIFLRNRQTHKL